MAETLRWSPLVDSHAHVFTPDLPRVAGATHRPERAFTVEDYLALLDRHDVPFGVLTAPSFLGTYNDYTRTAVRGRSRLRGTAIVEPETDPSVLAAMAEDGIVGIRYSLRRYPDVPDFTDPVYRRLLHRVMDLGWHLHLYAEPERMAALVPQLAETGVTMVLDHFGNPDGGKGEACPAFQAILRAIDTGRTWVKLSAPYRLTGHDPESLARRLLAAAGPERLVWASDWPWTAHENQFTYRDCIDWMAHWIPDRATRDAIDRASLKLFGFAA
ncbi:MAG: amidohydrolase family protein [Azospirillaceae bacterium]